MLEWGTKEERRAAAAAEEEGASHLVGQQLVRHGNIHGELHAGANHELGGGAREDEIKGLETVPQEPGEHQDGAARGEGFWEGFFY